MRRVLTESAAASGPVTQPLVGAALIAAVCVGWGGDDQPARGAEPARPSKAQRDAQTFFENRVRPLLARRCLGCHGAKKQEGGLRLDSHDAWQRGGDRGPAIVAGKPAESRLIAAIQGTEDDLQMPPDGKLTTAEIADLVEWVRSGAFDPRRPPRGAPTKRLSLAAAKKGFWSFQPLRAIRPPTVTDGTQRSAIDRFLEKTRHERGLTASPHADRLTRIRRVTFDLTGLPPTPREIDAFLEDREPGAWQRVIDRLLASPSYGERWGRHWLDVARYADTAGDGADYPVREAGKYRDWVIAAINADQPYDEFVREQIAGDLLAREGPREKYAKRVTATGFLAIGKRYGYKPSPDYQHLDFADLIDSVGRSVLGLSLGCARCHDHKYDPISAADYYALYGIFQSTQFAFPGGEEHKRPAHLAPLVPIKEQRRLEREHAATMKQLDQRIAEAERRRKKLDPRWRAGGYDLDLEAQTVGKPPGKPWVCAGPIEVRADAQSPFAEVHPAGRRGVRLGSGKPTDGLRYVFTEPLRAATSKQMHFTVDFRTHRNPQQSGAFRFYLGRGVVQSLAIECSATATEFAIRNGTSWEVVRTLDPEQWHTLRISIDAEAKTFSGLVGPAGDLTAFRGKRTHPAWDGVADTFICDAFGHVPGAACARDLDNLGLQAEPFTAPGGPLVQRRKAPTDAEELQRLTKVLAALKKARKTRAERPTYEVAYGVSEGKPQDAPIQLRGEPHRPGPTVPRRFLEVLGGDPVPADAGSGRLQLAHWLTRRSNPLTARVFVNRVWHWHFGRGLVSTPSDFGSRGARPSHPQLLDWLASRFIESGWSLKTLHRLILSSHAYQQSSAVRAKPNAIDPENRWLWRFARRPLDAESLRDAMLAISGRLDRRRAERHPFPPVGSWGFTIHHPFHARYSSQRRSVYLMIQRNRRDPYLALFDAADPNQSVARRQPTTTPTQALYLMNSPFVHQSSQAFAARIRASGHDTRARLAFAFRTAHGRLPPSEDLERADRFVSAYRKKLESQGQSSEAAETAAYAALGRVLLTGNALLYVD